MPISSETTKLNACITSFYPNEMKSGWVGGQKRLGQGCQSCRPSMNRLDRSRNRCRNAYFVGNNQTKCLHFFLTPNRDEIWMSWWTKRLGQGCQSCRPSMNRPDRWRNRCPNAHFIGNNQTKCLHYFLSPYRDEIWMSWWTKTVWTGLSVLSSVNESSRQVKKSLPERLFHRKQPN